MTLAETLRARIAADGPMRLDAWMAACNQAFYASADPLGRDFTTAPEISQMFGEMIGGWIGDLWLRAGAPAFDLVELGPGRGTLLADSLRVLARLPGLAAALRLQLVETSPVLQDAQAARLAGWPVQWHGAVATLPADRPLIIIANEFFDALPIRQRRGGQELHIDLTGDDFAPLWLPADGPDAEWSEAAADVMAQLSARLTTHGGAALIIDYGHDGRIAGDTLQALRGGERVSPFTDPGAHDLTAHVDFGALAILAAAHGLACHGPAPQGAFLGQLGIAARAAALQFGKPAGQAAIITAALQRLTAPQQMGAIFRALACTAPGWPAPAGFGMAAP
ncbi:class I SAM-dependent methyltransferase [Sandarakinorhabdus sp.]|uniref:class I SAM-dependent methyltransferase n=1 Tax=Sandarakinorhabdus sp. TaxID=1916663 RepID=UPI003F71D12B